MADDLYKNIPERFHDMVPTGVTAFQFAFEVCMQDKAVRHVDPEMVSKLREAYLTKTCNGVPVREAPAFALRDDDGEDGVDDGTSVVGGGV